MLGSWREVIDVGVRVDVVYFAVGGDASNGDCAVAGSSKDDCVVHTERGHKAEVD